MPRRGSRTPLYHFSKAMRPLAREGRVSPSPPTLSWIAPDGINSGHFRIRLEQKLWLPQGAQRGVFLGGAGGNLRLPRAQRRRQDHYHQDYGGSARPGRRGGEHLRKRCGRGSDFCERAHRGGARRVQSLSRTNLPPESGISGGIVRLGARGAYPKGCRTPEVFRSGRPGDHSLRSPVQGLETAADHRRRSYT